MLSLGIMSKFPKQCQNRPFCRGNEGNRFSLILWLLLFSSILEHRKQNNRKRHSKALFEKEPLLHLCLAYFEYFICHGIAIYNLIQTYFSLENRGSSSLNAEMDLSTGGCFLWARANRAVPGFPSSALGTVGLVTLAYPGRFWELAWDPILICVIQYSR